MLHNNADVRRCSYFELELLVISSEKTSSTLSPRLATSRSLIWFLASKASFNEVKQQPNVRRGRKDEQKKKIKDF